MNETPSKSQHLLTITLPKEQTTDSIKDIQGATIINEISCNTIKGPAIQLSISCSSQAVSSIIDLYRNEETINKTIQIINIEKVLQKKTKHSFN